MAMAQFNGERREEGRKCGINSNGNGNETKSSLATRRKGGQTKAMNGVDER